MRHSVGHWKQKHRVKERDNMQRKRVFKGIRWFMRRLGDPHVSEESYSPIRRRPHQRGTGDGRTVLGFWLLV